jgi:hypothetical protein
MSDKYKIRENDKAYFVTLTIVDWIDVFTRKEQKLMIVDSLKYCQENKGLVIFGYCIMSSHIHMICKANDTDAEWFEEDTYLDHVKLTDLQESTEYEYQVFGYCGTYESDYSDLQSFTTPEVKLTNFECGSSDEESSISNHEPLPVLNKGDHIWSGNFRFKISEATGSNGTFSGKAFALVPYLSFIKLSCEFESIKINTDKQVYEGAITSIYNPDSPFILGITIGDGDGSGDGDDTTDGDDSEISDTTFTTDIDSVYISDDVIIIVTEDGTDTIHSTDDIIIIDEDGDTWIVDGGEVVTGGGGAGPGGGGTGPGGDGTTPAVISASEIKIKAEFVQNENQYYGFDKLKYDVHKPQYEQVSIYEKQEYVPWKSISSFGNDEVLVKISDYDTTFTVDHVKFRTASGIEITPFTYEGKEDTRMLLLNGKADTETEGIEAYITYKNANDTSENEQEIVIGKLNTLSLDKIKINLVIVPVNGSAGFSSTDFTNALNDIYQQSVVEWSVTVEDVYNINIDDWDDDGDEKMNDGESTLLSNYSDEQNKLKRKYKNSPGIDIDKNSYYVFLLNGIESKTGLAGYMPLKEQYAFIYAGGMDSRTIAHELGHGAFRLWHTFSSESNYFMSQGSSDNLMDYADNAERLHKYQWDFIHNPEGGFYMFQDEDEGASLGDDICFTMENLLNNFEDWFSNNSDLVLFDDVAESFADYLSQIKENSSNIELEDYSGWSIRSATYNEDANSYLAEKIYDNILNDKSSSLQTKGIYLGEYEIEGTKYNTAVFSYKNEVNIKKFHTNELCELAHSEKIKVAIKDGYTLITFFDDNKSPEMVLQVNGADLKTAKTWLTYLGIFTEKTTEEEIKEEYEEIIEYWKKVFGNNVLEDGTKVGDPLPNPTITNTSNNEYKGYQGCVRFVGTCRDEYKNNEISYTNRFKTHDGIDFTAEVGTPIYAIKGGTIYDVDTTYFRMNPDFENDNGINAEGNPDNNANCGCHYGKGYGNQIKIRCELDEPILTIDGKEITTIFMRYGHLDTVFVRNKDYIEEGQIIGLSGCSGNAATYKVPEKPNYHVHIEADNESSISDARMVNVLDLITTEIKQPEP